MPPLVLLGKCATPDDSACGVSAYLFGLGVAGALAPYLRVTLHKASPILPFAVVSAVLVLATLALVALLPSLRRYRPGTADTSKERRSIAKNGSAPGSGDELG